MKTKRSFMAIMLMICAVAILSLAFLSASVLPSVQAQGGATSQQQTIEAIVAQRFAQTATANFQNTLTATYNYPVTATAAVISTLGAEFSQTLTETALPPPLVSDKYLDERSVISGK